MHNQDDLRIGTSSTHPVLTGTISAPISSQTVPESITKQGLNVQQQPERTYVFTAPSGSSIKSSLPVINDEFGIRNYENLFTHNTSPSKGHARSISHGGGTLLSSMASTAAGPTRQLKSAMKGHQRALSQGQISEKSPTQVRSGHTRVGSKTDFILPPGHKEAPNNIPTVQPGGFLTDSRPTSARSGCGDTRHSRQASRSESIYTLRRAEILPWWKSLICFSNSKFDDRGYRIIVPNHTVPSKIPNHDHPNGRRVGNKIHTTKYTLLSFLPKNLLEQFHRVANLYFIFIVLLNWFIDAFGKEIAMIPVVFVLGVTAIKDLFEDRRRRASDKRINNSTCRVYNGESERYKKIIWQDLRVGDIVHLSNNETIPADILLLRSSNKTGICYIDTCDLDGETNLKVREVVRGFTNRQMVFQPNKFTSRIEVDPPSTKIYRFHGAMVHPNGERLPISTENLLLRESRLKNTDYVEGLVVYAGHETKAMLNNSGPRYKRSQLEQQMNLDVIWCVIILIILCIIGAVGCKLWLSTYEGLNISFLPFDINPRLESLWTFWTYVIILQVMIPLSLYVTIELCKILQVYHIHNNSDLFDEQSNKKTECRAMNITEELGQVQHIFSDKTGTLTENKMIFRRCVINGIDYNHPPSVFEEECLKPGSSAPPLLVNPKLSQDICIPISGDILSFNSQRIQEFLLILAICNTVIVSAAPHRDIMNASGIIENSNECQPDARSSNSNDAKKNSTHSDRYIRLTESRSVTPSPPPNAASSLSLRHVPSLSPISSYVASSSDSESQRMPGDPSNIPSPKIKRKTKVAAKLSTITSFLSRKKRSKRIVCESNKTSPQKLTVPLDGRPLYEAESPDELALVNAAYSYGCCLINRSPCHILVNAISRGVVEYEVVKILPFDSTRKCMSIVIRLVGHQELLLYTKGADNIIMSLLTSYPLNASEIELREKTQHHLDLYAREGLRVLVMAKRVIDPDEFSEWWNRHQDAEMSMENREKRVRDSYSNLERNLTLIGATGIEDRLQEGVPSTIAALRLAGIAIWVLTGDKLETAINIAYSANLFQPQMQLLRITARTKDAAESIIACYLSEIDKQNNGTNLSRPKQRALVIDGKSLTFILDLRSNLIKPFLKLTQQCSCVLCCRVTPLQKAYLVKIVKEELRISTLAIGDGANDVSMIQMADIGVGISGQEGMQAVMASDFTLAKFKYLHKLLLVHGFWSYDRLARMILYFFYKNATFVFLIFWYQLYCGFSGTVMMDEMYLMLYNLFFTSLPPLVIGVYDKRVSEDLLFSRSYLYRYGRLGCAYKPHSFWVNMLDSLYQSLIIFFIAKSAYWDSDVGIWEFGTTITTICLITMLLHGAVEIKSWTILHVLSIALSLGAYYSFAMIYGALCVNCLGLPSTYWVIFRCLASPIHWLSILLTSIVCVIPRLFIRVLQASVFPDEATRVIVQQRNLQRRGEGLLVAWSRSTSASSIYRTSEYSMNHQYVASIG